MQRVSAIVELSSISKAFPGVLANDDINLTIAPGEIHALLGENGAGKSTLVKVLYGLLQADHGEIRWRGASVEIDSPQTARSLGIAMVFQHFSLFDSLTVLENIALGMEIDASAELAARVNDVSRRYGLPLDANRSVYQLSVGERQRIEIVRCLLQDPSLLIMDEPTSVLTPAEVDALFDTLRRLASEGVSILYISHKLEEIRSLCDTATILRGGRVVATTTPHNETARSLASLMMGEAAVSSDLERSLPTPAGPDALRVDRLSLASVSGDGQPLIDISLSLPVGQVTGIAGVAGNGQDELLAALTGEIGTKGATGSLWMHERDITRAGPTERRRLGIAAVPEERNGHAAVTDMTLLENALLTTFHGRSVVRAGLVRKRAARRFAQAVIDRFDVRCEGPFSLASSLSGGNLQKFVVGREILQEPKVLIVSQPTWGVDAGAAATIRQALVSLARAGSAVLVLSQDLDELMQISDTIGALCAGRLSEFYPRQQLDVQQIGLLMGGAGSLQDAGGTTP